MLRISLLVSAALAVTACNPPPAATSSVTVSLPKAAAFVPPKPAKGETNAADDNGYHLQEAALKQPELTCDSYDTVAQSLQMDGYVLASSKNGTDAYTLRPDAEQLPDRDAEIDVIRRGTQGCIAATE